MTIVEPLIYSLGELYAIGAYLSDCGMTGAPQFKQHGRERWSRAQCGAIDVAGQGNITRRIVDLRVFCVCGFSGRH
jgi:hypothetical protein